MKGQALKISFENPNTPEETADFLVKQLAQSLHRQLTSQQKKNCLTEDIEPPCKFKNSIL